MANNCELEQKESIFCHNSILYHALTLFQTFTKIATFVDQLMVASNFSLFFYFVIAWIRLRKIVLLPPRKQGAERITFINALPLE